MCRSGPMNLVPRERLTLQAMDAMFVCDVGALVEPDVTAVDALARLQLAARRSGCRITLQGVGPELWDLLELMGLRDVLPACGPSNASAFEAVRQPEEREEPLRVEEEADPGDASVADLEDL
jgi:ABC-type transporter Mla MlaB component